MVDDELNGVPGPKVGHGEEKVFSDGLYDPWHRGRQSAVKKLFTRWETPFLLIGAALILLIVVFLLFIPRGGGDDINRKLAPLEEKVGLFDKQLQPLEGKLAAIEERLVRLEHKTGSSPAAGDVTARLDAQAAALDRLTDRFANVESSVTQRVERILKDMEKHRKGADSSEKKDETPAKTASPATKAAAAPPPAKAAASTPKAAAQAPKTDSAPKASQKTTYHVVSAGETLFRISRQYKLTVQALRQLNKLSENASIRVGQKLIVSAAGDTKP